MIRLLSAMTLTAFLLQQITSPLPSAQAASAAKVPAIEIPKNIGKIEARAADMGTKGIIYHIQDAHGNEDAQRNIQEILRYLTSHADQKMILLEGGNGKLHPELLRFFPKNPELNLKIADSLLKKAELSGAERFLLTSPRLRAYGIESIAAYRENRKAFQKVLRAREKTGVFLSQMDDQIQRLSGPFLNPSLKNFLKKSADHEAGRIDFSNWLSFLKGEGKKYLNLDLEDPFHQREWPMLIRLFRLQANGAKINPAAIEPEKKAFLEKLRTLQIKPALIQSIQGILESNAGMNETSSGLPYEETLKAFGELLELLPEGFSFKPYENLRLLIQTQILQSELKTDLLASETEKLESLILDKLIQNETERKMVGLYKSYGLLQKLFRLELTLKEYKSLTVSSSGHDMRPSALAQQFLALNSGSRIKNVSFSHLAEIDELFDLALSFYSGARKRDGLMAGNALKVMRHFNQKNAVVVTGGFHTQGMKHYFESRGFSYYLITPRIHDPGDNKAYLSAMLAEKSHIALMLKIQERAKILAESDAAYGKHLTELIRTVLRTIPGLSGIDEKLLQAQYGIQTSSGTQISRSEMRSIERTEALMVRNDPKLKKIWEDQVAVQIKLFQFAKQLKNLTHQYGFFHTFPEDALSELMRLVDFKGAPQWTEYALGFITLNAQAEPGRTLQERFKWNLLFLSVLQKNGIDILSFAKENKEKLTRIAESAYLLNKLSTASEWQPEYREMVKELLDELNQIKNTSSLAGELGKLLLETFQSPRVPYYQIAATFAKDTPFIYRLLPGYEKLMPPDFFDHPENYFSAERQADPSDPKIGEVLHGVWSSPVIPEDAALLPSKGHALKIQTMHLTDGREIYMKRVNPLRVRFPDEEIEVASRVDQALQKAGPEFHAQEFIGIIYKEGSFYLLSLGIRTEKNIRIPKNVYQKIEGVLEQENVSDPAGPLRRREILPSRALDGKIHYSVVDFETLPYLVRSEMRADAPVSKNQGEDKTAEGKRAAGINASFSSSEDISQSLPTAEGRPLIPKRQFQLSTMSQWFPSDGSFLFSFSSILGGNVKMAAKTNAKSALSKMSIALRLNPVNSFVAITAPMATGTRLSSIFPNSNLLSGVNMEALISRISILVKYYLTKHQTHQSPRIARSEARQGESFAEKVRKLKTRLQQERQGAGKIQALEDFSEALFDEWFPSEFGEGMGFEEPQGVSAAFRRNVFLLIAAGLFAAFSISLGLLGLIQSNETAAVQPETKALVAERSDLKQIPEEISPAIPEAQVLRQRGEPSLEKGLQERVEISESDQAQVQQELKLPLAQLAESLSVAPGKNIAQPIPLPDVRIMAEESHYNYKSGAVYTSRIDIQEEKRVLEKRETGKKKLEWKKTDNLISVDTIHWTYRDEAEEKAGLQPQKRDGYIEVAAVMNHYTSLGQDNAEFHVKRSFHERNPDGSYQNPRPIEEFKFTAGGNILLPVNSWGNVKVRYDDRWAEFSLRESAGTIGFLRDHPWVAVVSSKPYNAAPRFEFQRIFPSKGFREKIIPQQGYRYRLEVRDPSRRTEWSLPVPPEFLPKENGSFEAVPSSGGSRIQVYFTPVQPDGTSGERRLITEYEWGPNLFARFTGKARSEARTEEMKKEAHEAPKRGILTAVFQGFQWLQGLVLREAGLYSFSNPTWRGRFRSLLASSYFPIFFVLMLANIFLYNWTFAHGQGSTPSLNFFMEFSLVGFLSLFSARLFFLPLTEKGKWGFRPLFSALMIGATFVAWLDYHRELDFELYPLILGLTGQLNISHWRISVPALRFISLNIPLFFGTLLAAITPHLLRAAAIGILTRLPFQKTKDLALRLRQTADEDQLPGRSEARSDSSLSSQFTEGTTWQGRLTPFYREVILPRLREISQKKTAPLKILYFGIGENGAPTLFDLAWEIKTEFPDTLLVGADNNPYYLELAQKEVEKIQPKLPKIKFSFEEGGSSQEKIAGDVDLILTANVLYYYPFEDQAIRRALQERLTEEGFLITAQGPEPIHRRIAYEIYGKQKSDPIFEGSVYSDSLIPARAEVRTQQLPQIHFQEAARKDIEDRLKAAGVKRSLWAGILNSLQDEAKIKIQTAGELKAILQSKGVSDSAAGSFLSFFFFEDEIEKVRFYRNFSNRSEPAPNQHFRKYLHEHPEIAARWFTAVRFQDRLAAAEGYVRENATTLAPFRLRLTAAAVYFADNYKIADILYANSQITLDKGPTLFPLAGPEDELRTLAVLSQIDGLLKKNGRLRQALLNLEKQKIEFVFAHKITERDGTSTLTAMTLDQAGGAPRYVFGIPLHITSGNNALRYEDPVPGISTMAAAGQTFTFLDRAFSHELSHFYFLVDPKSLLRRFAASIDPKTFLPFVFKDNNAFGLTPQFMLESPERMVYLMAEKIYQLKYAALQQNFPKPAGPALSHTFKELWTFFLTPYSVVQAEEYWAEALSLFFLDPEWVKKTDPVSYQFLNAIRDWDIKPARSEMRVPAQVQPVYRNTVHIYDPKEYDLRLLVNPFASGRLHQNPSEMDRNKKFTWDNDARPISIDFENAETPGIGAIQSSWKELEAQLDPKKHASADIYSYHNLFFNDWFAAYDGSTEKLLYNRKEPFEERTYSMFVVWKNKDRTASSEDLRFKQIAGEAAGRVYISADGREAGPDNNIAPEIESAFFGQRILNKGVATPFEQIALRTNDLFQLWNFPQFTEIRYAADGNITDYKYGTAIGLAEMAALRENNPEEFLKIAKKGIFSIDLLPYLKEPSLDEIVEKALETPQKGYRNASGKMANSLEEGEYLIEGNTLHMRLKPYPYPHNLIGITRSGKITAFVLPGDKLKNLGGSSIQDLPETIVRLYNEKAAELGIQGDPIQDVFLLANSRDAILRRVDNGKGDFVAEKTSARPYQYSTAAIALAKRSEVRSANQAEVIFPGKGTVSFASADDLVEKIRQTAAELGYQNVIVTAFSGQIIGNYPDEEGSTQYFSLRTNDIAAVNALLEKIFFGQDSQKEFEKLPETVKQVYRPPHASAKTIGTVAWIFRRLEKEKKFTSPETTEEVRRWIQEIAKVNPEVDAYQAEGMALSLLRTFDTGQPETTLTLYRDFLTVFETSGPRVKVRMINWWGFSLGHYLDSLKDPAYWKKFAARDQEALLAFAQAIDPDLEKTFERLMDRGHIGPSIWDKIPFWGKLLLSPLTAFMILGVLLIDLWKWLRNQAPQKETHLLELFQQAVNRFLAPAGAALLWSKEEDHYYPLFYQAPSQENVSLVKTGGKEAWSLLANRLFPRDNTDFHGLHVPDHNVAITDLTQIENTAWPIAMALRPDLFMNIDPAVKEEAIRSIRQAYSYTLEKMGKTTGFNEDAVAKIDRAILSLYERAYGHLADLQDRQKLINGIRDASAESTTHHERYHLLSYLLELRKIYGAEKEELMARLYSEVVKKNHPHSIYESLTDIILAATGTKESSLAPGYKEIDRLTAIILDALMPEGPSIAEEKDLHRRTEIIAAQLERFQLDRLDRLEIVNRLIPLMEDAFKGGLPEQIQHVEMLRPLIMLGNLENGKPQYASEPQIPASLRSEVRQALRMGAVADSRASFAVPMGLESARSEVRAAVDIRDSVLAFPGFHLSKEMEIAVQSAFHAKDLKEEDFIVKSGLVSKIFLADRIKQGFFTFVGGGKLQDEKEYNPGAKAIFLRFTAAEKTDIKAFLAKLQQYIQDLPKYLKDKSLIAKKEVAANLPKAGITPEDPEKKTLSRPQDENKFLATGRNIEEFGRVLDQYPAQPLFSSTHQDGKIQLLGRTYPDLEYGYFEVPFPYFAVRRAPTNRKVDVLRIDIYSLEPGMTHPVQIGHVLGDWDKDADSLIALQAYLHPNARGHKITDRVFEEIGKKFSSVKMLEGELGNEETILSLAKRIPEAWPQLDPETLTQISEQVRQRDIGGLLLHMVKLISVDPHYAETVAFPSSFLEQTLIGKLYKAAGFSHLSLTVQIFREIIPGRTGNTLLKIHGERRSEMRTQPEPVLELRFSDAANLAQRLNRLSSKKNLGLWATHFSGTSLMITHQGQNYSLDLNQPEAANAILKKITGQPVLLVQASASTLFPNLPRPLIRDYPHTPRGSKDILNDTIQWLIKDLHHPDAGLLQEFALDIENAENESIAFFRKGRNALAPEAPFRLGVNSELILHYWNTAKQLLDQGINPTSYYFEVLAAVLLREARGAWLLKKLSPEHIQRTGKEIEKALPSTSPQKKDARAGFPVYAIKKYLPLESQIGQWIVYLAAGEFYEGLWQQEALEWGAKKRIYHPEEVDDSMKTGALKPKDRHRSHLFRDLPPEDFSVRLLAEELKVNIRGAVNTFLTTGLTADSRKTFFYYFLTQIGNKKFNGGIMTQELIRSLVKHPDALSTDYFMESAKALHGEVINYLNGLGAPLPRSEARTQPEAVDFKTAAKEQVEKIVADADVKKGKQKSVVTKILALQKTVQSRLELHQALSKNDVLGNSPAVSKILNAFYFSAELTFTEAEDLAQQLNDRFAQRGVWASHFSSTKLTVTHQGQMHPMIDLTDLVKAEADLARILSVPVKLVPGSASPSPAPPISPVRSKKAQTTQRPPEFETGLDQENPETKILLDQFLAEVWDYFWKSAQSNSYGTLLPLIEKAKRINPAFQVQIPKSSIHNPSLEHLDNFDRAINSQIFLPFDLHLHILAQGQAGGWSLWVFDPGSWESYDYLGSRIWTSKGRFAEGSLSKASGMLVDNKYPSLDSEGIKEGHRQHYRQLLGQLPSRSRWASLQALVKQGKVTENRFVETILNYVEGEEKRHAEDSLFSNLLPPQESRKNVTGQSKTAAALLKKESSLMNRLVASGLESTGYDRRRTYEILLKSIPIVELAGQTGNLFKRMDERIKEGNHTEAYLLFLYQLIRSDRELEDYNKQVFNPNGGIRPNSKETIAYAESGKLFFESLAGLPLYSAQTIHGAEDFLQYFEGQGLSVEQRAAKARDLIREIHHMHFWTEGEREQMLKEKALQTHEKPRSEVHEVSTYRKLTQTLLDGIVPLMATVAVATAVFLSLFSERIQEAQAATEVKSLQDVISGSLKGTGLAHRLESLLAGDNSFAVVGIPVPANVSRSEIRQALKELQPFLDQHPNKLLALAYDGNMPGEEKEAVYKASHEKVLFFKGGENVFSDFYAGRFSRLGENAKTAERLLQRAREMTRQPVTVVSLAPQSVIISPEAAFSHSLSLIGRQFLNTPLSLSPVERLIADILYAYKAVSVPADKLKENLDELTILTLSEIVRFGFDSGLSGQIQSLVQAARRILAAA